VNANNRLQELDSLRGLAALSVAFSHHLIVLPVFFLETFNKPIWPNALKYTPLHIFWSGHEAVVLFFIMSGFVLSLPFYAHKAGSYTQFLTRRFCRIYIPYIVSVVAALMACALFSRHGVADLSFWFNLRWNEAVTWKDFWQHASLIGMFRCNEFNPVLWSLVHEARISLIFPFLMWLVMRLDWRVCLALSYAAAVCGYAFETRPWVTIDLLHTCSYLPMFVVGIVLARWKDTLVSYVRKLSPPWQYAQVALAVALYTYPSSWAQVTKIHTAMVNDIAITAGAAMFVVLALSSTKMAGLLNLQPVKFLGKISYSFYLYHAIVMLTAIHLFFGRAPLPVILCSSLVMGVVVSWLAYRLVEVPSISLGRWLTRAKSLAPGDAVKYAPDQANDRPLARIEKP